MKFAVGLRSLKPQRIQAESQTSLLAVVLSCAAAASRVAVVCLDGMAKGAVVRRDQGCVRSFTAPPGVVGIFAYDNYAWAI